MKRAVPFECEEIEKDVENESEKNNKTTPSTSKIQKQDSILTTQPGVSLAVKYYTIIQDGPEKYGLCKLCKSKKLIKMTNSNTTGLKRHLQNIHTKHYLEIYPQKCIQKNRSSQIMDNFLLKSTEDDQPLQLSDLDLVKWMSIKYLPFSFFDDRQTQDFFKMINPSIILPKRNAMKRKVLDIYHKMKENVIKKFNDNRSKFSFTIDGWTSIANKSFYGITVHYIDEEFILQSLALDFVPSNGKHSGKDVANIFFNVMKEYNLTSKIQGITVDNTASNTTMMHELSDLLPTFDPDLNHFRCFAHIINLGVQDFLKILKIEENHEHEEENDISENEDSENDNKEDDDEDEINLPAISKLRRLLMKLKRSEIWTLKLKSSCETTNSKFLQPNVDVCTRWNSTYNMIKLSTVMRAALDVLCENNTELQRYRINKEDWALFSLAESILKSFKLVSTALGGEKYVTLPLVVTTFNMLLDKIEALYNELILSNDCTLNRTVCEALTACRNKMVKHYNKSNWIYCAALVLDPRHKVESFDNSEWGKSLKLSSLHIFEELYKSEYWNSENCNNDASESTSSSESNESDNVLDISNIYVHKKKIGLTWRYELDTYYQMKYANNDEDILKWWQTNGAMLPNLTRMSRDILSITATSVPAERLFSRAGLIMRKHRNRLNAESARTLLCINSWTSNSFV